MAIVKADDIVDLVAGTLKDLGRLRFQQIAQDLQNYEIFAKWFKKDKVQFDSGYGIQRQLMTSLGTSQASHVGLFAEDNVSIPDLIKSLSVPWVHAKTDWAFEYREVLMNRGKSLIFNIIKPRRTQALINLASEIEDKAWSSPALADTELPYGIPYYVVRNTTTGFNGGAPTGHTTVANINPTANPNWKNYTAQYTTASKADFVKKVRTALRKCNFISPVAVSDYTKGSAGRYRMYVNETLFSSLEDIGESQNENLGRDIAWIMNGTLAFRQHPIVWVPKLDSDTQDPVYGIDHSQFFPVCLAGDFLRESPPRLVDSQHNTYRVFVDLTYNYLCVNRRAQFRITK